MKTKLKTLVNSALEGVPGNVESRENTNIFIQLLPLKPSEHSILFQNSKCWGRRESEHELVFKKDTFALHCYCHLVIAQGQIAPSSAGTSSFSISGLTVALLPQTPHMSSYGGKQLKRVLELLCPKLRLPGSSPLCDELAAEDQAFKIGTSHLGVPLLQIRKSLGGSLISCHTAINQQVEPRLFFFRTKTFCAQSSFGPCHQPP